MNKTGLSSFVGTSNFIRNNLLNWLSSRYTVEFLGVWEQVYNPDFNRMGFHTVKNTDGRLVLTPKRWVEMTNAIGIFSKSGRYGGGIFAHKDIAFEFGTWLSAEFKFYLIREFQRLKEDEQQRLSLEWNLQRTLSKINYRIHTDAIKIHIIPLKVTKEQSSALYASEADLLNVALFGKTAQQWRQENSEKNGNIRDNATLEQLVVLSNLESINALLIKQGLSQQERLIQLNEVAITQMKSLLDDQNLIKRLE
ncbi:KilA-N domain-containing protein [Porphyromonadaceae bacterium OttesenSCG-928-L07]|nr:KilA-N domain-containing protein [Porphyromonadaceae bacterium OttesenSCG-928-L07]MDL2331096.1 KilA-N domain-containing protein [Odoribacter sp. OttesenSCG-928-A06]